MVVASEILTQKTKAQTMIPDLIYEGWELVNLKVNISLPRNM